MINNNRNHLEVYSLIRTLPTSKRIYIIQPLETQNHMRKEPQCAKFIWDSRKEKKGKPIKELSRQNLSKKVAKCVCSKSHRNIFNMF